MAQKIAVGQLLKTSVSNRVSSIKRTQHRVPDNHRDDAPRSRYARRGERLDPRTNIEDRRWGASRVAFWSIFWLRVFSAPKQNPRPPQRTPKGHTPQNCRFAACGAYAIRWAEIWRWNLYAKKR